MKNLINRTITNLEALEKTSIKGSNTFQFSIRSNDLLSPPIANFYTTKYVLSADGGKDQEIFLCEDEKQNCIIKIENPSLSFQIKVLGKRPYKTGTFSRYLCYRNSNRI
jgi:hypothetical protein